MLLIAFLAQLIIYLLMLLYDDYVGSVISLIMAAICLGIWIVARLVELVERSQVSATYYRMMLVCFVAPIVALLCYELLQGGFYWLQL